MKSWRETELGRFWLKSRLNKVLVIGAVGLQVFVCSSFLGGTRQAATRVAPPPARVIPTAAPPMPIDPAMVAPTVAPTVVLTKKQQPTRAPAATSSATPVPLVTLEEGWRVLAGPAASFPVISTITEPQVAVVLAYRESNSVPWYHIQVGKLDGWVTPPKADPDIVARVPRDAQSYIVPDFPTATPEATPATEIGAPNPAPSGRRIGAICRDGTRSSATGRGACSHHGGVAQWLYG